MKESGALGRYHLLTNNGVCLDGEANGIKRSQGSERTKKLEVKVGYKKERRAGRMKEER